MTKTGADRWKPIATRLPSLAAIAVLWLPILHVGLRPYRLWLLARRLEALQDLEMVDASLVPLLTMLLIGLLAAGSAALLPNRWLPTGSMVTGGFLLSISSTITIIGWRSEALSPAAGVWLAVATGAVLTGIGVLHRNR